MHFRWMVVALLASSALTGCAETTLQPEGSRCVRSTQCEPGLACVAGACTSDLSGLEGGVVPSMDAGMMMVDAGPPMDAGPPVDSGPGVDSGPTPVDSGPPPVDSGPPPVDSGPPPVDSGPPPVDSGPPLIDAG